MSEPRSQAWLCRQLYGIAASAATPTAADVINDAASLVRMGDGMRALGVLLAAPWAVCAKAAEEVAKWLASRAQSMVALDEIRASVGQRAEHGPIAWALQQREEELRKQAA